MKIISIFLLDETLSNLSAILIRNEFLMEYARLKSFSHCKIIHPVIRINPIKIIFQVFACIIQYVHDEKISFTP